MIISPAGIFRILCGAAVAIAAYNVRVVGPGVIAANITAGPFHRVVQVSAAGIECDRR